MENGHVTGSLIGTENTDFKKFFNRLQITDTTATFRIQTLLKQTRPGYHLSSVSFSNYQEDRKMCIIEHLKQYIKETADLRNSDQLIISNQNLHAAVSSDTIARWIRTVLLQSGVDMSVYSAHSTRAAS